MGGANVREAERMRGLEARGRRKKTAGGAKGQPASGSAINYKAAAGCLEPAHRGISNKG